MPLGMEPMPKEDSRRIMACFEACKGIPTEALEAGVVGDLIYVVEVAIPNHKSKAAAVVAQHVLARAKGESP